MPPRRHFDERWPWRRKMRRRISDFGTALSALSNLDEAIVHYQRALMLFRVTQSRI